MSGLDHDLEGRLHEGPVDARENSEDFTSSEARWVLAVLLSVALLVSLATLGRGEGGTALDALGGAALNAVRSSVAAVRSAFGNPTVTNKPLRTSAGSQYHDTVKICSPAVKYIVKVTAQRRILVYTQTRVDRIQVPDLTAKGAVLPVPAGGCSSLNHPTKNPGPTRAPARGSQAN